MNEYKSHMDKVGIACSLACLVHCFSIPFLSLTSPLIAQYFETELIHFIFLIFIIPIALISMTKQKKVHQKSKPLILGIIGVTLLMLSLIISFFYKIETAEIAISSTGSFILIFGHYLNIKMSKLYLQSGDC